MGAIFSEQKGGYREGEHDEVCNIDVSDDTSGDSDDASDQMGHARPGLRVLREWGFQHAPSLRHSQGITNVFNRVSGELSGKAEELANASMIFDDTTKAFRGNVSLAISVGLWIAVVSLPSFSMHAEHMLFGQRGEFYEKSNLGNESDMKDYYECHIDATGRMRNIGDANWSHPRVVPWNENMSTWSPYNHEDIWCGYWPAGFLDYWPNLAQFVVFTVYRNSGTTINLAWQGLVGTCFAVLNLRIMFFFFTEVHCADDLPDCDRGSRTLAPHYQEWMGFVDTFGVLCLFLLSRSAQNTIMFGMSWHVFFMMTFLDPVNGPGTCYACDCVLITTIIGCVVSILATLTVPQSLLNSSALKEGATDVTGAVVRTWTEALEYFTGNYKTVKRFQVERHIELLDEVLAKVNAQFNGAWWETFDQGARGKMRILLAEFASRIGDVKDMLYVVQHCCKIETFKGAHGDFVAKTGPPMTELAQSSFALMYQILAASADGVIESSEVEEITTKVEAVKNCQRALLEARNSAIDAHLEDQKTHREISKDLAEEYIFAYAISAWARRMREFAETIVTKADENINPNMCKELFRTCCDGIKSTWAPSRVFGRDHLKFVARNWIAISVCFMMGYCLKDNLFEPGYSSTMAGTLSLLIMADGSHQVGSSLNKNLHRLLGVTLGKCFPIILATIIMTLFPTCRDPKRTCMQFFMIWAYLFMWLYIYYASLSWNYCGCLIAGFSVYQLLLPCKDDYSDTFPVRYREIAQVTIAIAIQIMMQTILFRRTPRELACKRVRRTVAALNEAYTAFFDQDLQRMQDAAIQIDGNLQILKSLAPECDPKMQLAPLGLPNFKVQLLQLSLDQFTFLLADLNTLISAIKDWKADESALGEDFNVIDRPLGADVPRDLIAADTRDEGNEAEGYTSFQTSTVRHEDQGSIYGVLVKSPAMAKMKEALLDVIDSALLQLLPQVLEHTKEEPLKVEDSLRERVFGMCTVREDDLEVTDALYEDINKKAAKIDQHEVEELTSCPHSRLNVAIRMLESSAMHILKVEEYCVRECV